jgi:hypothetical protein
MRDKSDRLIFNELPVIFRSTEDNLMAFALELDRDRKEGIHITAAAYGNDKNFHK